MTHRMAEASDQSIGNRIPTGADPGMRLVCTVSDNRSAVVWVTLIGVLDPATSPSLEEALRRAEVGAQLLLLDLRGLTSADATGAHLIVDASDRARLERRRLVVTGASDQVDSVLALAGAADVSIPRIALPPFWALFEPHGVARAKGCGRAA